MKCWICGAGANTSEHRLKRSDLVRAYGRGPYRGDDAPVHFAGDSVTVVQGPSSARIKYEPSLCNACNSSRTQPFDRAYDSLVEWILANESIVTYRRLIDFAEVYGDGWEIHQRNLFKYFVKSLGCRIVSSDRSVPPDLIELLDKDSFSTHLGLSFAVNEDVLLMPRTDRNGFIGKGDLMTTPSGTYQWSEHVSWFFTFYWYGRVPAGPMGSLWVADAQHVYLGSFASISEEDRPVFLQNVIERHAELSSSDRAEA